MARRPRLPAKPQPLPADVRLMRTGASVLFAFALLAFVGLVLTWALRAPPPGVAVAPDAVVELDFSRDRHRDTETACAA